MAEVRVTLGIRTSCELSLDFRAAGMSVGVVRKVTSVKWPQPTLRPADLRTFRSSHHARARMGSDHQGLSRSNTQWLCTGGDLSHALPVMDVQQVVVDTADDGSGYLLRLRRATDGARAADSPVTYVVIGLFPGFPEVGTRNKALLVIAQAGLRRGRRGHRDPP